MVHRLIPKKPPHILHADTHGKYPTHTHGLDKVGLPEIFINASAFGPYDNGRAINAVVMYLYENEDIWNSVVVGKDTYVNIFNGPEDPKLILRKVATEFTGVELAYNGDVVGEHGYRQLYVEGDDFVLTNEYFQNLQESESPIVPCSECEKGG